MTIEKRNTRDFWLKFHQDALIQRRELIEQVVSSRDEPQAVFKVSKFDALTPQEIQEIIQCDESISDMASRVRFHIDCIKKLEESVFIEK